MRTTRLGILGAILLTAACGPPAAQDPVQESARRCGIEIIGVQLMADGDVARLNYRVVDYDTAKAALRKEVQLFAGAGRPVPVMATGRLGPLRQRPTRDGRPQFMMFMNPGRTLVKGERATITIGQVRIEGVPIS
jgi:hypothetical protein